MLQDRFRLVLLDRLGHHVKDIVHDSGAEFEIEMRLDALLGDCLGDTLAVATFELSGKQISQPDNLMS